MLPVSAEPGSGFNPQRKHPITGKVQPHTGQDFPCPVGTPVRAVLPGKVEKTGFDPKRADGGTGAGRFLRIDHGLIDGHRITSRAYHLSAVLADGQVDAGEVVALSGNTGDSTGPHLHFEIRVDGTPVEPLAWLAAHTTAETPEEGEDMSNGLIMLAKNRPHVFVVPGVGARVMTGPQWDEAIKKLVEDEPRVFPFKNWTAEGDVGTARYDLAMQVLAPLGPQVDPDALAAAIAKALPAATGGPSLEQLTTAVRDAIAAGVRAAISA